MVNALFSVQEFKCDKTVVPGAVFFKLYGGQHCEGHHSQYCLVCKSKNCKDNKAIKHQDNKIFVSYHNATGKPIGFVDITNYTEIDDRYSRLLSYAECRLDEQAKSKMKKKD